MSSLPIPSDAGDLVASLTGQPALFSDLDVSVDVVRAGRDYLHTGTTTSAHHEAAAKIIMGASLGWSERRIAREFGHSRNTVGAVLRDAVKSGKLEPVKERVVAAAANAVHADIELSSELMQEAKTPQEIAAVAGFKRATWVGVDVVAKIGADRQPAAMTVNVAAGSVVQVVEGYGVRMEALKRAAVDYESNENARISEGIEVKADMRSYGDTEPAGGSAAADGPGTLAELGKEGGGGVGFSTGGTE